MTFTGANAKQRQRKFEILVNELGGRCIECGSDYDLEFHHRPDTYKAFEIGSNLTRSIEVLREEADKCVLLCYSCHRGHNDHIRTVHGYGAYVAKRCFCHVCRQAYIDYNTAQNRKRGRKERVMPEHGTRARYSRGCKCEPCRTANAQYLYRRNHPT